jgi:hypothetical protein
MSLSFFILIKIIIFNCIFYAKISYVKLVILSENQLNKYMSLIYKQALKSPLKKANELMDNSVNVNPTIKHLLKCTSCLWEITFYEPTAKSIPISSKKMYCPACKEKEMNSSKIKIIS